LIHGGFDGCFNWHRHPEILAIEALILDRSKALGLSRPDLVRRAGYRNVAKGLRRLGELCTGEMKTTASLIAGLSAALELPPEAITDAIRQTERQLDEAARIAGEEREAAWRKSFRPCAYLLGTETRPTQITIYGMTGGSERWLKIPLELSQPAVTFASQAVAVASRTPVVPFFGKTIGFIVKLHTGFRREVRSERRSSRCIRPCVLARQCHAADGRKGDSCGGVRENHGADAAH
jgi:hypothetical protein